MLHKDFPTDPHAILDPIVRWYPGDDLLHELGYEKLLPPLVHKIRKGVKQWRDSGYAGASAASKALLRYWFEEEHPVYNSDGTLGKFAYFFAQREAVESVIWLYEIEEARDPYGLIKYDATGAVGKGHFQEDWTRYVLKMATGSGKTKVISLLLAWSYFHRCYEPESDLSRNFLVIAPNIIVLERLKMDFAGLRVFFDDPVLPYNGYEGRNWQDDFQLTVHIQDEIGVISDRGNIFLSNIHRVFQSGKEPSFDDEDTTDYFLGPKPVSSTTESGLKLDEVVREVPDLVIFNDEAHHIHDAELAWFKNIEDISNQLRLKGSKLSAQLDLTATPKHNDGAIFVQTICDYPLVEAIRQGVVKTPVLPDEASRAKLNERISDIYVEQYEDYIRLGYEEWRKTYDELKKAGKKSVLFVMTDETGNCDKVGEYLEDQYPEFKGAVLVIHTNQKGQLNEKAKNKAKREELEKLREASKQIDSWDSQYKAIVSVMMLREGWDVQNVTAIVGLRPYSSKSQILPEQTLGRGLRRMFRGENLTEKVSVIGTDGFITFVEQIKSEGVELEYAAMGGRTPPKAPMVVEVDRDSKDKDVNTLDIAVPVLAPRIYREYKNLHELKPGNFGHIKLALVTFSADEQREIVFKNLDTGEVSHKTRLDTVLPVNPQSVVGYFVQTLMSKMHLVGGFDILYEKLKEFIERHLFEQCVNLDDPNTLRNLSEIVARTTIEQSFKRAIDELTVQDRGTTEIRDYIQFSKARPQVVQTQDYVTAKRTLFNKVIGDSRFELEFAVFLDTCDIVSFVKNEGASGLKIEYCQADGGISNYVPDFVVKETETAVWIIETKGREDLDDPLKWARLKQWCQDATTLGSDVSYRALFVREELWDKTKPTTFAQLVQLCMEHA